MVQWLIVGLALAQPTDYDLSLPLKLLLGVKALAKSAWLRKLD